MGLKTDKKTGDRERNVGHPNGEEHSRVPKGNGIKRVDVEEITFGERATATGLLIVSTIAVIYLVGNDVTGVGAADDAALIPAIALMWDSASKAFG